MDTQKLANLLYPNAKPVEYWLEKYPPRELKRGAEVTRLAPSPTGYLHTGHAYSALINKLTAEKSGGIFYLRLEDTDQKRLIEHAGDIAYNMLVSYNLSPNEGYRGDELAQIGDYGDYVQSKRLNIYQSFAKFLVEKGRAFPCFCKKSEGIEDVEERRQKQLEESGEILEHDPCRNLSLEEIEEKLAAGEEFALKLKSKGDPEKTFKFTDLIKGEREIRENAKDIVLMKSNGIPPYAFAHAVDDSLMHTTIVVRGEEWYPSLSAHIELFKALGFKPPKYAHTPVICKLDENGNKRKLSKRKDPEADVRYFIVEGYPKVAVIEYLLNLLNSDFEPWRAANPTLSYKEFPFSIEKIGSNNPMFDFVKLADVSKNYISHLTADEVYSMLVEWAKSFDVDFCKTLTENADFSKAVLNIDRDVPKPRKDISKWSEVKSYYDYMFYGIKTYELDGLDKKKFKEIIAAYKDIYSEEDDKETWFNKIKAMAESLGYATNNKDYKANPESYKGNVADVCTYIRLALTGRKNSPDIYSIARVLGAREVNRRFEKVV
ncbi:MAG TPA: glutamate--tRNA ligase [Candidatus Caccopulliclostridium gallistercoris]|uniref:Glutamate--tRNA ligase n=1 Tax=Candidatus Caccopulliclostridium gallistercoris TaxID=2840719 RepID=A0A9D1NEV6_9FIRM|nr:glutamate--tRNA ligase [Candidatus Caccopulliclostridium gallistercoris]